MRILILLLISVVFFACKKSTDNLTTRLFKIESTDNSGNVLHTAYNYDNENRIITITQYQGNAEPSVINISYNGDEVVLLSHPGTGPAYNETTEVHLLIDANGRIYAWCRENLFCAAV